MKHRVLYLAPLLLACGPWFYMAPPPLEKYPQRTPGKRWKDLFNEAHPAAAGAATADAMDQEIQALAAELPKLNAGQRQAKIGELMTRNREGEFRANAANFLNELEELAKDDAALAASRHYLDYRLAHPLKKFTAHRMDPPASPDEFLTEEQVGTAFEAHLKADLAELDGEIKKSPPAMLPYWKTQRALYLFRSDKFAAAEIEFSKVMTTWPKHPRAEVAEFMVGRCALEFIKQAAAEKKDAEREVSHGDSAKDGTGPTPPTDDDKRSKDAFRTYLADYPKGRFASDAHGWLAAGAAYCGRPAETVNEQLERWSIRPSREVVRSVLKECDEVFAGIIEGGGIPPNEDGESEDYDSQDTPDFPWDGIAAHPELVRLLVYQTMDPAARESLPPLYENFGSDRSALEYLDKRLIQPQPGVKGVLRLLSKAVVKQQGYKKTADPLTLFVLGTYSLRSGQPAQALAFFDAELAQGRHDEALHGRALALSALKRYPDAAAAYTKLAKEFPDSPLGRRSYLERAVPLYHAGQAGEAVLALIGTNDEIDYSNGTDPPEQWDLHTEFECQQWRDTILQFAPLDQLMATVDKLPADDAGAKVLWGAVRGRALAAERFDLAHRYLDAPVEKSAAPVSEEDDPSGWQLDPHLDATKWDREVQPLAAACEKLKANPGDAGLQLQTARLWKALRGKVTMPLMALNDFSESEGEKIEQLRRHNAEFLGIDSTAVTEQLDSEDELVHALKHFLAAADLSKDPEIAAPALEEANEALFQLASFSRYRESRALENNHSALSAKLVARLQSEFPNRPESKRAIAWVFDPAGIIRPWMPGDYNDVNCADKMMEAVAPSAAKSEDTFEPTPAMKEAEALGKTATDLVTSGRAPMPAIRKGLEEIQKKFTKLRSELPRESILGFVDDLDDLRSVAEAPTTTAPLLTRYAEMRDKNEVPPAAEGEWAPYKPWLAFEDRIRRDPPPNEDESSYGGYSEYKVERHADTIEAWEAYLKEFPNGPKTEAASLRLLRLRVRALLPIPQVNAYHFPEAPLLNGYKRSDRPEDLKEGDLQELRKAVQDYRAKFPAGRYQADFLLLEASVLGHCGDPGAALADLATILADPAHPELRMDAALELAGISLRLLDPPARAETVAAFRKTPAIMPFLKNLIDGDTCVARLRPMLPWLEKE
jgi:TolA-binding protein